MTNIIARADLTLGLRRRSDGAAFSAADLLRAAAHHKWLLLLALLTPMLLGLAAAAASKTVFLGQARFLVLYGSEFFFAPTVGQPGAGVALDRNQIILGELQILESPEVALETLRAVGVDKVYPGVRADDQAALERAVARFDNDLTATSIAQSNVIELSFRSQYPDVVPKVLNMLLGKYLERRDAVFGRSSLDPAEAERVQFSGKLDAAETALAEFARAHGIVNLDEQVSLLLREQSANAADARGVDQTIDEASARLEAVKGELATTPETIEIYREHQRSQESQALTDSLLRLQNSRAGMQGRYQDNSPLIQDKEREIAALQQQLAREPAREGSVVRDGANPLHQDLQSQAIALQGQLHGLEAKRSELAAAGAALTRQLADFSVAAKTYRALQRDRDVLDETFRIFSRKIEETRTADALESSRRANIRVVQPPQRPSIGRNPRAALAAGGVVLGLLAATATLALLNATRDVLLGVRDTEQALDLPVLLTVPLVRHPRRLARLDASCDRSWADAARGMDT